MKAEGLAPIEETYTSTRGHAGINTYTKIDPRTIPATSDHHDRCRDFAKGYIFPDASWRKVWSLYARGTSSRAIAAFTGLCRTSVQWRIKHTLIAMRARAKLQSTMPRISSSGHDILAVFVESASPPCPPRLKLTAVRTWRSEHAAPGPVIIRRIK